MKKNVLLTLISILSLALVPTDTYGQGFLKKLKQKVEKAVGMEEPTEESNLQEETEEGETPKGTVTATDRLPKLHTSTSVWDEMVQPSKASSVNALLNELPALPSISELAVPTAAARQNYYRKIVAVDLRVRELDEQNTCPDEEMLALRDKMYQELAAATGLTAEEMKQLDDPNLSETERERLAQKAADNILGAGGLDKVTNMASKLEALEKEKGRKLTDEEMMQFASENPGMMEDMMGIASKTMESTGKLNQVTDKYAQLNQRLMQLSEKQRKLREKNQGTITSCEKIAQEYEEGLKAIYRKIFATEDREEIDRLYAQTDEQMKNYRTRAAKLWRNSLQTRLNEWKAMQPELERIYKEMSQEGLIPPCATNRASYNLVTGYTDILNDAYADFPQPKVLPVQTETIFKLKEHESLMRAESGFASSVDDFLKNSRMLVFDGQSKEYVIYENGERRAKAAQGSKNYQPLAPRSKPAYNTWTSKSGTRRVEYARDDSLTLQDGTSFYPLAFKAETDKLVWIIMEDKSILKCTYKL